MLYEVGENSAPEGYKDGLNPYSNGICSMSEYLNDDELEMCQS